MESNPTLNNKNTLLYIMLYLVYLIYYYTVIDWFETVFHKKCMNGSD